MPASWWTRCPPRRRWSRTGGRRSLESGTVGELLATPGSELAGALFPVGGEATDEDRTVVDVTFHGVAATRPFISQLSRTYHIDIFILGAAIDTVGGLQVGRMRIELPGRYEDNVVPIGFLRELGLRIAVVDRAAQEPVLLNEDAE